MNILLRLTLSLVLFLPWGFADLSLAETALPMDEQITEGCTACHASSTRHPETIRSAMEIEERMKTAECQVCHRGPEPDDSLHPERAAASSQNVVASLQDSPSDATQVADQEKQTGARPTSGEMVTIPAGSFIMGTNQRLPDEGPEHTVTLKEYRIDRYEVANAQYKRFVDATRRQPPDYWKNGRYPKGKSRHPVTYVSWYDATAYCHWDGKRLPTDEEWEKAARGPHGRTFPWGDEFDKHKANVPALGIGDTTPVGSFETGKSYYGLYDMSGNVWEWTGSWYKPYPGNRHPTENYGEKYRVLKGGSWFDCSFYKCGISAPSYNRSFFIPETKNASFGFRCAKD
jgi:formylglycine-generating enzyme required for sulfatase activity